MPSGLTWIIQYLDIIINKVLKENLRKRYVNNCIKTNNVQDSKSTIIEWIEEIWNSKSAITNEMIFNSLKYSGISCSLDGSEEDMFSGYDDLENGSETIEIENEEGSDRQDQCITFSCSSD